MGIRNVSISPVTRSSPPERTDEAIARAPTPVDPKVIRFAIARVLIGSCLGMTGCVLTAMVFDTEHENVMNELGVIPKVASIALIILGVGIAICQPKRCWEMVDDEDEDLRYREI